MIELRHLRSFLVVARELHFGRAARHLHIAQPALSVQIRHVEVELGTLLFLRNRRRVELTSAGHLFRELAADALERVEHAISQTRSLGRGEIGSLRIGYSASALHSGILGRLVRRLREDRAAVELRLEEIHPGNQIDALVAGRVDICFGPTLAVEISDDIEVRRLASYPLRLAVPRGHPLSLGSGVEPDDLASEGFIGYEGEDGDRPFGGVLVRHIFGFEPRITFQAPDPIKMIALVDAGLGVALVSAALAAFVPGNTVLQPIARCRHELDVSLLLATRAPFVLRSWLLEQAGQEFGSSSPV